jgi:acyl carrier protein
MPGSADLFRGLKPLMPRAGFRQRLVDVFDDVGRVLDTDRKPDGFRQNAGRWKLKMRSFSANVQGRVLALVKTILEQNSIAAKVDPESRLVDVGLTSMDMVNLMLGVEAEFDFTIPQSEITPENFQSVKTLELMIVGQLQPEAAA